MTVATEHEPITADQLLELRDDKDFELVHGELVERHMGWESERIGANLLIFLGAYCLQQGLGWVNGSNASYQCFERVVPEDPGRVRKPDVSFISLDRLASDERPTGHCEIVPDLVVEVISPNDLYYEVEAKVDEYLRAGVRLVWVVDPHTKSIRVHRTDGTLQDLHEDDELSGESVVTGFRCEVRKLFDVPVPRT